MNNQLLIDQALKDYANSLNVTVHYCGSCSVRVNYQFLFSTPRIKVNAKLKKVPVARPPMGIEYDYALAIRKLVRDWVKYSSEQLIKYYQSRVNQSGSIVNDIYDDLEAAFRIAVTQNMSGTIRKTAGQINDFQFRQFKKQVKSVYGIEIFEGDPWLQLSVDEFTAENLRLIKNISTDVIPRMQRAVQTTVTQGQSTKDLIKYLKQVEGYSEYRATLIGKDQVGKFYGSVTQARQQQYDISYYDWLTSGDRRVRPSHSIRDGNTYSWTNPEHGGGHPGQEILCRCSAIPNFEKSKSDFG